MQQLKYIIFGILFGIVLIKAEVASWFRIQEMFRFDSFHMFGVIFSAVIILSIIFYIAKRLNWKAAGGEPLALAPKDFSIPRYLIGGTIFGFGWALTGACPGPLFALFGKGYLVILVPIATALLGTYVYGLVRHKLPH